MGRNTIIVIFSVIAGWSCLGGGQEISGWSADAEPIIGTPEPVDHDLVSILIRTNAPITSFSLVRAYYQSLFSLMGIQIPKNATVVHLTPEKLKETYSHLNGYIQSGRDMEAFTLRIGNKIIVVMPDNLPFPEYKRVFSHEIGHVIAATTGGNKGEEPAETTRIALGLIEIAAYPEFSIGNVDEILTSPEKASASIDEYEAAELAAMKALVESNLDTSTALRGILSKPEGAPADDVTKEALEHDDGAPGLYVDLVDELAAVSRLQKMYEDTLGTKKASNLLSLIPALETGEAWLATRSKISESGSRQLEEKAEKRLLEYMSDNSFLCARHEYKVKSTLSDLMYSHLPALDDCGTKKCNQERFDMALQIIGLNKDYPNIDFPAIRPSHVYSFIHAADAALAINEFNKAVETADRFLEVFKGSVKSDYVVDQAAPIVISLAAYAAYFSGQICRALDFANWVEEQFPHCREAEDMEQLISNLRSACE
ncbi:MAG: hypothetical protein GXP49_07915 [Deltaproteobacteria bacterium]|nr:hypothetical protein [Deltaproteobacteria bacterium]